MGDVSYVPSSKNEQPSDVSLWLFDDKSWRGPVSRTLQAGGGGLHQKLSRVNVRTSAVQQLREQWLYANAECVPTRHPYPRPGRGHDAARRLIRGSLGNRAKESLLVDFINQNDLDQIGDKASVIDAFFTFAQAEQQREAQELIATENLNAEAARRYLTSSLKREFASENGTELNALLPKMSPLNPKYLTMKQSVFQKIAAFVEKFKGVGGDV